MKISDFSKYLLALLMGSLLCTAAWGWNGAGHRLVAHIAWSNLSPSARQICTQLLHQHADYPRWADDLPIGSDSALRIFSEASTWADDIRRDPRFSHQEGEPTLLKGFPDMDKHSHWHYSDANDSGHDEHLYAALPQLYALLKDARQPAATRAYALVWLLHLVGDAHQPLHNGFREDRGGNEVPILVFSSDNNHSTNLHAFWDDLPGKSSLRGTALLHIADGLIANERITLTENRPDFVRWRNDNLRTSRQFSYPPNLAIGSQTLLTSDFIRRSQTVANRQLVLAGKRLALVLETALGSELRTPFHVERHPEK